MMPRSMLYDPLVPGDAKLVYLVLSGHAGGNQMAWPSHRRMAELIGLSVSTVKRQLHWLRDNGYLRWEARAAEDGTQTTNSYTLLVGSAPSPAKEGGSHGTPGGSEGTGTRSQRATPPGHTDLPPRSHRPTNESHLNESHLNERSTAPRRGGIDAMFEEFWSVYPRREAKAQAKVKFAAALRKVDFETILVGACRYRDDPNREAAFTAHPSTWLYQGRWDDEPLPPRGDRSRANDTPKRPGW